MQNDLGFAEGLATGKSPEPAGWKPALRRNDGKWTVPTSVFGLKFSTNLCNIGAHFPNG
jgi:hypothetical protein